MTKSKYHNYVIVLTNEGPKFVTSIEPNHYAKFDKFEKPLEMSYNYAKEMAIGLIWNGFPAYPVRTEYEIEGQPFVYKYGQFKWISNEESEEN